MATAINNVKQANSDIQNIKKTIIKNGVLIEDNTKILLYDEKINKVYDKGNSDVLEYAKANYSPAISQSVSDSVVAVHDVSPIEHDVKCKLRSENVIKTPYYHQSRTIAGVQWTVNNDYSITCNGEVNVETNSIFVLSSKIYINEDMNITANSGLKESSFESYYMFINVRETSGERTYYPIYNKNVNIKLIKGSSMTIDLRIRGGVKVNNLIFKPKIQIGSQLEKYTPYISDFTGVNVERYGGNLIDIKTVSKWSPDIDISWSFENHVLTMTGTATSRLFIIAINRGEAFNIPKGTYYMQTTLKGTYPAIVLNRNGAQIVIEGANKAVEILDGDTVDTLQIRVYKGDSVNGICDLQLSAMEIPYTPYIPPVTYPSTPDGTVPNIKSISPNMTLIPDKEGVVMDVDYNADPNIFLKDTINNIKAISL